MSKVPDTKPEMLPESATDQQAGSPRDLSRASTKPKSWPIPRYSAQTRSTSRPSSESSGIRTRARAALHTALPTGERILLLGSNGQVGGELARILAPLAEVILPTRAELDLTDEVALRDAIRRIHPRWILNAAAYTAVDRAESEPASAYAINSTAVRILGEEAVALDAAVIHLSTDYVFDGSQRAPYTELDRTNPRSVYGASKLAGEQALAASGATHIILRTSWVYGATGHNFLKTILQLARERRELSVVNDQYGAPTWSRDLARLIVHIVIRSEILAATGDGTVASGIASDGGVYHATGGGETTWYGFASSALALLCELNPAAVVADVEPIATIDYPTPARRPLNSRLDCSKLSKAFDWQMMQWEESLAAVLLELSPSLYPD